VFVSAYVVLEVLCRDSEPWNAVLEIDDETVEALSRRGKFL